MLFSSPRIAMTRLRLFHIWLLVVMAGPPALVRSRLLAENPDAACAGCHREIYDSYQRTPMAQASGAAIDGLLPGEFTHAASGVHYRLFVRDGRAWLSYDRPNPPPPRNALYPEGGHRLPSLSCHWRTAIAAWLAEPFRGAALLYGASPASRVTAIRQRTWRAGEKHRY
jgi:hypothetical protein